MIQHHKGELYIYFQEETYLVNTNSKDLANPYI